MIVRAVDAAVKTIYSPFTASTNAQLPPTLQRNPEEPIVINRPNAPTSSARFAVRAAFALAASMGACAHAVRGLQLRANGYEGGRAHPGLEDV
jgi:hypothetical protein